PRRPSGRNAGRSRRQASQIIRTSPDESNRYQVTVTGSMVSSTSLSLMGRMPHRAAVTMASDKPRSQRPDAVGMKYLGYFERGGGGRVSPGIHQAPAPCDVLGSAAV